MYSININITEVGWYFKFMHLKNSFLNYDSGTSTLHTCTCVRDIYLSFIIYKTQFWIEILLFSLLVILSIWDLFPKVETSQAGSGNREVTVNGVIFTSILLFIILSFE